jgi:hypothetical protein
MYLTIDSLMKGLSKFDIQERFTFLEIKHKEAKTKFYSLFYNGK